MGYKYKYYSLLQSVAVIAEEVMEVKMEKLRTNPIPQGRANRRIVVGTIFVFINVDFLECRHLML